MRDKKPEKIEGERERSRRARSLLIVQEPSKSASDVDGIDQEGVVSVERKR